MMNRLSIALVVTAITIGTGYTLPTNAASVTSYTNEDVWQANVTSTTTVIDFESIALPANDNYVALNGNEFSSLSGSPKLINKSGAGLFVGSPGKPGTSNNNFFEPDFVPTSGSQVFSPNFLSNPQGSLTIKFTTPTIALGVDFLDVEGGFANSGFDIDQDGTIDIKFASNQGDNSQAFLGFIAETPFSSVDIWMSNYPGDSDGVGDGVGLDNLQYVIAETSPVPEPLTILGSATALGFGALLKRESSKKNNKS